MTIIKVKIIVTIRGQNVTMIYAKILSTTTVTMYPAAKLGNQSMLSSFLFWFCLCFTSIVITHNSRNCQAHNSTLATFVQHAQPKR
uniref:Uncharacterized protein n=1 Tax=Siphoviridae sp. ctFIm6 TaxID=2827818 RepID=A0A8S5SK31_9CAUD|nr:MAG TPA: hypothetical protein [Siphoviridae sp. ctFIm6]